MTRLRAKVVLRVMLGPSWLNTTDHLLIRTVGGVRCGADDDLGDGADHLNINGYRVVA